MRPIALWAGVALFAALAFVVLTSALLGSTAIEAARAVWRALGRANQWAPR